MTLARKLIQTLAGIVQSLWKFQGETEAVVGTTTMQTFPFASDSDSTSLGFITYSRTRAAGCSGPEYAYKAGSTSSYPQASQSTSNIMKFPFSNYTSSSLVGTMTENITDPAGFNSEYTGYSYGGNGQRYPSPYYNIDRTTGYKFPFASDTNASYASYLYRSRSLLAGISAPQYGYTVGGFDLDYYYHPNPSIPNTFAYSAYAEKFPFASDTSRDSFWTYVSGGRAELVGQSSEDDGYCSGGMYGSPTFQASQDDIFKFPFSSDTSRSIIGQLSISRKAGAGVSSTTYGYQAGGVANPPSPSAGYTVIDKFPFASDTNASDVADLTVSISTGATGHQS